MLISVYIGMSQINYVFLVFYCPLPHCGIIFFFFFFTVNNKMIVFKQALPDPSVDMTDTLLNNMDSQ